MTATIIDPGPGGDWPAGTVPIPDGVHRPVLRDDDVMDPWLPEELFNPATGAYIGRGPRPAPDPKGWAEVWGLAWPPEAKAAEEVGWSRDRFDHEVKAFSVGATIWGALTGPKGGTIGGVIGLVWSWLRYPKYRA